MNFLQKSFVLATLFIFLKFFVRWLPSIGPLDIAAALLTAFLILHLSSGLPWHMREGSEKSPALHRFSDPETCLKILKGETYDDSLGVNQLTPEESRAIPNQRLVRAFQIDNGFTTNDHDYGRLFRRTADRKLRDITRGGWSEVGKMVQGFTSTYMERFQSQTRGHLDLIVQIVALKTVLLMFFDVNQDAMTDEVVIRISKNINLLWIQSKSQTAGNQSNDFETLQNDLKHLGLEWSTSKENPLNLLLPVYESLWRVVARCLIEVVFRPSADPEWLLLLETFRADPTSENFSKSQPGQDKVSVAFPVKEALRLYPPTRRIYRQVHLTSKKDPEVVAVDIEACHRLPHVWGEDSHRYRPARWNSVDENMRRAFMPFGGSPWICPANSNFGPMMIGLLVATFASSISAEEWELQLLLGQLPDSNSRVLDDETELDSNRQENTAWEMIKRSGLEAKK
ncbi:MAG: hypothetical protein Q9177_002609 [Variospora cf. flavescens]